MVISIQNASTSIYCDDNCIDMFSPVECHRLKIWAIFACAIFIFGLIFNVYIMLLFVIKSNLKTETNTFLIVLTSFNLIWCITDLPFFILGNFQCKYEPF